MPLNLEIIACLLSWASGACAAMGLALIWAARARPARAVSKLGAAPRAVLERRKTDRRQGDGLEGMGHRVAATFGVLLVIAAAAAAVYLYMRFLMTA